MGITNQTISTSSYRSSTVRRKTDGSLKGYLQAVASLEAQLWNQNRLIDRLNTRVSYLGVSKSTEKPQIESSYKIDLATGIGVCAIIAIVVAFFMFILLPVLFELSFIWTLLASIAGAVIAFIVLSLLWIGIEDLLATPEHLKKMSQYNANLASDRNRIQRELKLKQELIRQIESVKFERQRTRDALDALYSLSVIHPSYRNLVAVSSFYDYFDKGICNQLQGRSGAYAFYEEDLRFHRLEAKLDIIIEKLDQIAAGQQFLASLIRNGNAALNRIEQQNNNMAQQLKAIEENSAVTAYNSQCSAESLSVMESISIYKFYKD